MIVCLMVLRASGRGGLGGCSDLGPCLVPVVLVGVGTIGFTEVSIGCLVWRQCVTGIKVEVVDT